MLIGLTVENWMSFRDALTLSMLASRERQHRLRLAHTKKRYDRHVLPISVIYGGNASGKFNLVKALRFAKELIVEGSRRGQWHAWR